MSFNLIRISPSVEEEIRHQFNMLGSTSLRRLAILVPTAAIGRDILLYCLKERIRKCLPNEIRSCTPLWV